MKSITLPSGTELQIDVAPFVQAKALYQAVLEELNMVNVDPDADIDVNLYKQLVCIGFSSKKIESALKKCMERALYNGLKITDDTFEPIDARDDYLKVCVEVAKENISPFVKSLYAEYSHILVSLFKNDQALRPETKTP